MTNDQSDPSQETRDKFSAAIQSNDLDAAKQLLVVHPSLANADLRQFENRDQFTSGLPLVKACMKNQTEVARLLISHGADPNSPSREIRDSPEFGLPLHYAAVDHQSYKLAHFLLDSGASPNGYPYCSQATIEAIFYTARTEVPSADWNAIVRLAFIRFLPHPNAGHNSVEAVADTDSDAFRLLIRMLKLDGQLPFSALVRERFNDLVFEILESSADQDGTQHDYPNSTVFNNAFGAARWFGYPDYRNIIEMQLNSLRSRDELQKAIDDIDFAPHFKMATDFTWHSNYGYRASIATPESYSDLANLFLKWGFDNVNHVDSKTGHSTLSAAVDRGKHPGISHYIEWLLGRGASVTDSERFDPIAIAKENGHAEILDLLTRHQHEGTD